MKNLMMSLSVLLPAIAPCWVGGTGFTDEPPVIVEIRKDVPAGGQGTVIQKDGEKGRPHGLNEPAKQGVSVREPKAGSTRKEPVFAVEVIDRFTRAGLSRFFAKGAAAFRKDNLGGVLFRIQKGYLGGGTFRSSHRGVGIALFESREAALAAVEARRRDVAAVITKGPKKRNEITDWWFTEDQALLSIVHKNMVVEVSVLDKPNREVEQELWTTAKEVIETAERGNQPEASVPTAPVGFPVYPPIQDADPQVRERRIVRVPTRLIVELSPQRIGVSVDESSLAEVEISVGHKMVVGFKHSILVVSEKEKKRVSGGLSATASIGTVYIPRQANGTARTGEKLEVVFALFETDIPVQHEWMPGSGKYKELWSRAILVGRQPSEQLKWMGPEGFFATVTPSGLIAQLRDSDQARRDILPPLLTHCFVERSMVFPEGILRLREAMLEEAKREGQSVFRVVADAGPNSLRLATVEWMAGQRGLLSHATVRALGDRMMHHLAADSDPQILLRATRTVLHKPRPFVVPPSLLSNAVLRTLERVQVLASDGQRIEMRALLLKLSGTIDVPTFRTALGDADYEALAHKAAEVLWPLTTQDVVYGSASWTLEKLNTRALNEKFYLRATDENSHGRSSSYDQRVILVNHPQYLRTRVRNDCDSILNQWTHSFAARNGTANPPALPEGAGAFFDRNDFLLKLAASYGDYDLVDRAARHKNKWYHELARRALQAYPPTKDAKPSAKSKERNPSNGHEPKQ